MRIAYIVLTCEAYWNTRVIWQKQTVFRHVPSEDIYYLGHKMDIEQRLFSWGAPDDYPSLPYKFIDFFRYSHLNYDWYVLIDDDTYVYTDRLREHLLQREHILQCDPDTLHIEGYILTHLADRVWGVYHSGGAGTILSHSTYQAVSTYLRKLPRDYRPPHWCADICLGLWTRYLPGIQVVHYPGFHIHPYSKEKDSLDTAITFHQLRTEEDFIHHSTLLKIE